MIAELPQVLKKSAAGDLASQQTLLNYFKEQKLSAEEQEQAHFYLKQAARQSFHAIYMRGLLYDHGYGVKQDFAMSFLLMREASAKGHVYATYEVGRRFLEGIGVEKNYENALQWLRIAAGSPLYVPAAMYDLGQMYAAGLGVEVDAVVAQGWIKKAEEKGYGRNK